MSELTKALLQIIFLGLAFSCAAVFIAKSLMLEELRGRVDRKYPKIGYALKCAYCVGGWLSLGAVVLYKPLLLSLIFKSVWPVVDIGVSWFALWGLTTLFYRWLWPFLLANAPKMRIRFSDSHRH